MNQETSKKFEPTERTVKEKLEDLGVYKSYFTKKLTSQRQKDFEKAFKRLTKKEKEIANKWVK